MSKGITILLSSVLVAWVTLNPVSVFAQGKKEGVVSNAPSAHTPGAIDTSKPWTRKAAFQASEGRIVLHYGEGIPDISARLEAESLSEHGHTAIAVPGGPNGQVELFVGGKIIGKFDEHQLDTGFLGMHAIHFYNTIIKKAPDSNPEPPRK